VTALELAMEKRVKSPHTDGIVTLLQAGELRSIAESKFVLFWLFVCLFVVVVVVVVVVCLFLFFVLVVVLILFWNQVKMKSNGQFY
jgi:Flp pilus assembly protein TadB